MYSLRPRFSRVQWGLAAWVTLISLVPADAYAYLDPATGSMIFQGLIAGLLTAVVAIKMYWARIKTLFSGKKRTGEDERRD